ncbi:MAG: alpha/beta hydrolase [Alphaproteobacteria bacterium]|nr:alpha/beta hydrolase [Alphaproteobacteria bacterium]
MIPDPLAELEAPTLVTAVRDVAGLRVVSARAEAAAADAPAMLFIHGAYHGWWVWRRWMPIFAGFGNDCHALSLPGHEGSAPLAVADYVRLGQADYVAAVRAVLDWIGRPAVLIAHSMGGLTALKAAEAGGVTALVLVASASPKEVGRMREYHLDPTRPVLPPAAELRDKMFATIDDAAYDAFYARLVPESPTALNDSGEALVSVDRTRLASPRLFVRGGADASFNHAADRLARALGGDWIVIEGAGHDMMLEPCAFEAALVVERWLNRVLPTDDGVRAEP